MQWMGHLFIQVLVIITCRATNEFQHGSKRKLVEPSLEMFVLNPTDHPVDWSEENRYLNPPKDDFLTLTLGPMTTCLPEGQLSTSDSYMRDSNNNRIGNKKHKVGASEIDESNQAADSCKQTFNFLQGFSSLLQASDFKQTTRPSTIGSSFPESNSGATSNTNGLIPRADQQYQAENSAHQAINHSMIQPGMPTTNRYFEWMKETALGNDGFDTHRFLHQADPFEVESHITTNVGASGSKMNRPQSSSVSFCLTPPGNHENQSPTRENWVHRSGSIGQSGPSNPSENLARQEISISNSRSRFGGSTSFGEFYPDNQDLSSLIRVNFFRIDFNNHPMKSGHREQLRRLNAALARFPRLKEGESLLKKSEFQQARLMMTQKHRGVLARQIGPQLNDFTKVSKYWIPYWQRYAKIDVEEFNAKTVVEIPYIFITFLVFVEMILCLIPYKLGGEAEEGFDYPKEMNRAVEFFNQFRELIINPQDVIASPLPHPEGLDKMLNEKKKVILNNSAGRGQASAAILWHFLEGWLNFRHNDLWMEIRTGDGQQLHPCIKGFFNFLYFYGYPSFTESVIEILKLPHPS